MKQAQGTWKPSHGGMEMDALSSSDINKTEFQRIKKKRRKDPHSKFAKWICTPGHSFAVSDEETSTPKIIEDSKFNMM